MFEHLSPRGFAAFLADIWKQRGWKTSLNDRAGETFTITLRRGDGKRGLLYVLPDADRRVGPKPVKRFALSCRKKGVDVRIVATRGSFAPEARSMAEKGGVHLLDPDGVRRTVADGGFEDLLRQHAEADGVNVDALGGNGGDFHVPEGIPGRERLLALGAAIGARLPDGLAERLRGAAATPSLPPVLAERLPEGVGDLPLGWIALVAALALVLFGGGLGVGQFVAGGGAAADAPPITAVSTADRNASLEARWNARVTSSLTANGSSYDAPEGERFVVVQFNVTNAGDSPVALPPERLVFESDGRRFAHQPLTGARPFAGGLFAPGESTSVWLAFSVPAETTGGTVLIAEGASTPRVRFVRDADLRVEAAA